MKQKKTIPFEFVLEALTARTPVVKPMFGCHAVYVGEKIVFILRHKKNAPGDNGVWLATTHDHHASLKKELPCLRPIQVFGDKGGWQNIPEDADDFEEAVLNACELILRNDPRVGKKPKPRKRAS
jgi:hypothetical protein